MDSLQHAEWMHFDPSNNWVSLSRSAGGTLIAHSDLTSTTLDKNKS
jgi:hypothetical protein